MCFLSVYVCCCCCLTVPWLYTWTRSILWLSSFLHSFRGDMQFNSIRMSAYVSSNFRVCVYIILFSLIFSLSKTLFIFFYTIFTSDEFILNSNSSFTISVYFILFNFFSHTFLYSFCLSVLWIPIHKLRHTNV